MIKCFRTVLMLNLAHLLFGDGCSPHPFTDVLSTHASPDGQVIAAYVVEAHGPMAGVFYGITLSPPEMDSRDGEIILGTSEDDRPIAYDWEDANTLTIRLPCGWWGYLTNFYQIPRTSQIIAIRHNPSQDCPASSRHLPFAPK